MAGKLIGAHDGRADSNYSLLCQLEYKNKTQLPCHQGDCNLEAKRHLQSRVFGAMMEGNPAR